MTTHEAAAQKLRAACTPDDLLGIQSDLMSYYLEGPSQYWQQVAAAGLQTQIELMARVNHMFIGKTGDRLKLALSNFQVALPSSEKSFLSVVNQTALPNNLSSAWHPAKP